LQNHLARRFSGDDSAHPIFSEQTSQVPSTPKAEP
jgi:hypothetical protein